MTTPAAVADTLAAIWRTESAKVVASVARLTRALGMADLRRGLATLARNARERALLYACAAACRVRR